MDRFKDARDRRRHGPEAGVRCTTPGGTAVSDGFLWILRLIRAFGSPNMSGARSCAPGTVTSSALHLRGGHRPRPTSIAPAASCSGAQPVRHLTWRKAPPSKCDYARSALVVVVPRRAGAAAGRPVAARAPGHRWPRSRWGWPPVMIGRAGTIATSSVTGRRRVPVRADNGRLPRRRSLRGGQPRHIRVDRAAGRPMAYDPAAADLIEPIGDPQLDGTAVARRAPVRDVRARIRTLRHALPRVPAERGSASTAVPARRSSRRAAPWGAGRSPFPLDRARAAHQREPDRARSLTPLRVTAASDEPAATCGQAGRRQRPGPARAAPGAAAREALGLAGRPLGPRARWPPRPDAYRAMLHGAPYPGARPCRLRHQPAASPRAGHARSPRSTSLDSSSIADPS